ncbi:orcokinin peptides isoform X4 [Andrena cerasifolii]|uniref:orcokinin peptides isoform X4 n=1 Tax=Andrena cerasifolii TaxID=2819439 RepID=UPI004037DBF7
MTKHRALAFPILLLPIATFATAWVAAVPHQAGSNDLQRGLYGPASAEYFGPYLEEHDSMDPRVSRLDNVNGHRDLRFNDPTGRDFDLPATVTLDRIDVLPTGRRVYASPNEIHHRSTVERTAKRNIDEIDRTAFDNFVKRNMEKQLIGWNGLVKRLNDFLAFVRSNDFETVA